MFHSTPIPQNVTANLAFGLQGLVSRMPLRKINVNALRQENSILKQELFELENRAIIASKNATEDAISFAMMIVNSINV